MSRTQMILAGLLVLQLALIALFRSPFADAHAPGEAQLLLSDLDTSAATRLELAGADGEVTMRREGDRWAVDELGGFPADPVKIDDLLATLAGLKVREPVVASSRHHDNLGITDEENQGRVRVFAAEGSDPLADLVLGSSPNYRVLHLRRAGADAVYEVRGLAAYDVRPDAASWAHKQLIDIPAEEISGLVLENAGGRFELSRGEAGWTVVSPAMVDGALDAAQVDALLGAVTSVRLAQPVGAIDETHGFAQPTATLTLRAPSGDVVFLVGAPVPEKETQRYVTRAGFGFTGTIPETSIRAVLDRTLDELLGG